jgi:hypothetical protein
MKPPFDDFDITTLSLDSTPKNTPNSSAINAALSFS